MKKILIVGDCPSKSGEGKPPLCGPRGTGGNLAKLMDVSVERMHRLADCINLFNYHGKFTRQDRRNRAKWIKRGAKHYSIVILLGGNVADAFDIAWWWNLCILREDCAKFFILPHPSSRNRWYNDENNRVAAEYALRKIIKDLALQAS